METLIVVAQHRNNSSGRNRSQFSDRFGSAPSRGFKGGNCRSFERRANPAAILTSRPRVKPSATRLQAPPKQTVRSSPIPIARKREANLSDDFSCTELWAGPAYSNSPPPSSLPIPKFSLRQKRSVSLDLPSPPALGIAPPPHPIAKSAPSSPTRQSSSPADGFFFSTAFATQNLRRILNLDIASDD